MGKSGTQGSEKEHRKSKACGVSANMNTFELHINPNRSTADSLRKSGARERADNGNLSAKIK